MTARNFHTHFPSRLVRYKQKKSMAWYLVIGNIGWHATLFTSKRWRITFGFNIKLFLLCGISEYDTQVFILMLWCENEKMSYTYFCPRFQKMWICTIFMFVPPLFLRFLTPWNILDYLRECSNIQQKLQQTCW